MRVVVESVLPCPAERAWDEVCTSRLLCEVAAPVMTFRPVDGDELPEVWPEGRAVTVRCKLFGVLPIGGVHSILLERIDPEAREIQSRESDPLIRRWDHLISIEDLPDGRCLYRDEIDIEAGPLTAAVWLFAQGFYRHRQRRWQRVARRLAAACA